MNSNIIIVKQGSLLSGEFIITYQDIQEEINQSIDDYTLELISGGVL